jgi:hypothetical protein
MNTLRRGTQPPQGIPVGALFKSKVDAKLNVEDPSGTVVTVNENGYTPHMRVCMLLIGAVVCLLIIIAVVLAVENSHKSHKLKQGQLNAAPNLLLFTGFTVNDDKLVSTELKTVIYEFKMTKQVQKWETIPNNNDYIPGITIESQRLIGFNVCCFDTHDSVWTCSNSPSELSFLAKLKLVNEERNLQLLVHALSVKFVDSMCTLQMSFIT